MNFGWKQKDTIYLALIIYSVILVGSPFFARAQDEDVDLVALASMLIQDSQYVRAERTLLKINKEDQSVDRAKIQSLWGMIFLGQNRYVKARSAFLESLKLGLQEDEIYIYLTEVELKEGKVRQADVYLSKVGDEWRQKLPFLFLRADVFWKMGKQNKAWNVLNKAYQLTGGESFSRKKEIFLFDRKKTLSISIKKGDSTLSFWCECRGCCWHGDSF